MNNTPNNIYNTNKAGEQQSLTSIDTLSHEQILAINNERKRQLVTHYDPITGIGCCMPRVKRHVAIDNEVNGDFLIPETMAAVIDHEPCHTREQWEKLRISHDFEYWCATCITILNKLTGRLENMILNRPQRHVLAALEKQRLAGKPLRIILLKARQWGGSTLTQVYMMWIQLVLKKNWNSLICGHMLQTAGAIKGMYQRALRNYPKHLAPSTKKPALTTFEGNRNVQQLAGTESLVIAGSARSQDAVRGYDVKMAHLTEVAFWPATPAFSPDDVIRSIGGTIPLEPLTMLVMESTANGVGNFFHNEWLRAKAGLSDKEAIFVPWYEIEMYRLDVDNLQQLLDNMDDYEKWLWQDCNCTLEMINWYHHKRMEYPTHSMMAAEFPTTDIEAFTSTSQVVFSTENTERMRHAATLPLKRGDMVAPGNNMLDGATFVDNDAGPMELWKQPQQSTTRNRYLVVVDIGGANLKSDWSVIAVFDRHNDCHDRYINARPEVVAQWRGHIDHDQLAWKAAQIARYYNNAQLVFESNTLECDGVMDNLVINKIRAVYPNIYFRLAQSPSTQPKIGFQTNRSTKRSAIYNLIAYVRDGAYIERDIKAIDEMACYEIRPNGKGFGARPGKHDDILMTRAIAMMLIEEMRLNEGRSRAVNPDFFIDQYKLTVF